MEKKSKVPSIIIIILILIIIGLGIFICFEKGILGKGTGNVTKDYDLEKAKKLIDKYYVASSYNDSFGDGMPEGAKAVAAIFNTDSKYADLALCGSLYLNSPNAKEDKDETASQFISDESIFVDLSSTGHKSGGCDERKVHFYSYDAVNETYKELFGEDTNIPKEPFNYETLIFDYLSDYVYPGFARLSCRCGIADHTNYTDYSKTLSFGKTLYFVKSAKSKGNELIIKVAYAKLQITDYAEYDGTRKEPEAILTTTINGEEVTYHASEIWDVNFENKFKKKYIDKMDVLTFTFELEDDHYVLKNMTK